MGETPVSNKHRKITDIRECSLLTIRNLPVVVIITEKTTSAHINVLFLFLLLFLGLLLLLLGSGSSSTGSGSSSASSGNRNELVHSRLDQFLNVLSLQIGQELLNLLVLSLSANSLQNRLDVFSLQFMQTK